jgi:hypothetical protein
MCLGPIGGWRIVYAEEKDSTKNFGWNLNSRVASVGIRDRPATRTLEVCGLWANYDTHELSWKGKVSSDRENHLFAMPISIVILSFCIRIGMSCPGIPEPSVSEQSKGGFWRE